MQYFMALDATSCLTVSRGLGRVAGELVASGSSSSLVLASPTKKRKRAETKLCPVCQEAIPIRLLATHLELEMERVNDIMSQIGSAEVIASEFEEGSRNRRSAARARKFLTSHVPIPNTLEQTAKTIHAIKRRRKQRHAKLRDMTRDEDQSGVRVNWAGGSGDQTVCPVCSQGVSGDDDVIEAHVDACLAHQAAQSQEETERASQEEASEDIDVESETRVRMIDSDNLRGMGFHVRDRQEQDVEDEVDVDGDDEAVFGNAQFTEGDILCSSNDQHNPEVDVPNDGESDGEILSEHKSLRDLVSQGKVSRRSTHEEAHVNGDKEALNMEGMRNKWRQSVVQAVVQPNGQSTKASSPASLTCRICLDLYTEPTVSTGCWHTCCQECWLRSLGTTKLCPICKRITAASDLRRIYL